MPRSARTGALLGVVSAALVALATAVSLPASATPTSTAPPPSTVYCDYAAHVASMTPAASDRAAAALRFQWTAAN
jgi:ABC-type oligopeptide transport system substrate-binding subunit